MRLKECPFFSFLLAVLIGSTLLFSACGISKEKHIARGEEYLQKRKFQPALMEFRAAADIDKNSAQAHYGLARTYENLGQVYEAIQELQQVAQFAPDNLEAKAKLGNYFLLIQPAQTDEAQKVVDDILQIDPNFIEGHVLKASLFSAQKKSEKEILDVLNYALALDPNRIPTYVALARFYMKENKADEAEKTIQKAIAVDAKSSVAVLEYARFLGFANRAPEAEAQFQKAIALAPESVETREAAAGFYLEQRQLEKAEKAYKDLAEIQGNSPEGKSQLAEFYATVGRDEDAIRVYQEILTDAPEFASARYRLGEIYLDRKEFAQVNEQAEKLLAANKSDAQALMLRARVKIQENNTDEAITDLEEVLKRQPSFKPALFYMAQSQIALGQIDEARAFIGDLEKYHPNYLNTKLLKIQASFAANEPENALRTANELIETAKNSYPTPDVSAQQLEQLRVRGISYRGMAYLELGKIAEAKNDLQEVLRMSPNSAGAYINLAQVFAAEKNSTEALKAYEKAAAIDAKNFDALTGAINVLNEQKQFAAAHDRVDKAIAENGNDRDILPALHYLKADVFTAQKDSASAEAELQKAIETDENYLPAYSAYAALLINENQVDRAVAEYKKVVGKKQSAPIYTLLGILEDARQNYDEAEKNYRKALEIMPDAPIAANNLAWNIAAYDRGNLDEALTLAQKTVGKNSANAAFYDTLGWIYFKKGLLSPAVEQLKKAAAIDEAAANKAGRAVNPSYRLHLGTALASAGDKLSARKAVEVALQNEKELSRQEAADAKNLLATL